MPDSRIALIRHGQTQWSASGRHTSTTDVDLTEVGEEQARSVSRVLAGLRVAPVTVLVSPRLRAQRTAGLAGLPITSTLADLAEWNYGEYEGLTRPEIQERQPDWSIFTYGAPGGETPQQVGTRADRALAEARAALVDGDVALISHGHLSRVLAARWIDLAVAAGANLSMETAAVTVLSIDRGTPMIEHSNVVPMSQSAADGA